PTYVILRDLHAFPTRCSSDLALVGMGATVLDGAEVGEGAFIGAGSLVTPGTKIPPNTLALGSPARVVRDLNEKDLSEMKRIRAGYVEKGQYYKQETDL